MILDITGRVPEVVQKEDAETIRFLAYSPYAFHLTGSHYFGCNTPESDVDWIVQDSDEVRAALKVLGFKSVFEDVEYECTDIGTADVWQNGKVQVQLAHNAVTRIAVRDILYTHLREEHKEANREQRGYLWGELTSLLTCAKKIPTKK